MGKLFVLGNGFDIQHGFHTQYRYFKGWLDRRIKDDFSDTTVSPNIFIPCEDDEGYYKKIAFVKSLCDHCNSKADWRSFEADLINIDIITTYTNNIDSILEPEDFFTIRYDDVCNSNAELLKEAISWIPYCFSEWIEGVRINKPIGKVLLSREYEDDSLFLTFNYTETLESVYGVDQSRICYIHGRRQGIRSLIIGHGGDSSQVVIETDDYVASELQRTCIDMLKKPVNQLIEMNGDFFNRIDTRINDVYFYGFSFGDVDIPYIRELVNRVAKDAVWHLSDFEDQGRRDEIASILRNLGVKGEIQSFDHGLIKKPRLFDL